VTVKKAATVLAFAFAGWAVCAATMGIGMSVTTVEKTLVIHAIVAPIAFGILSFVYSRRYSYTSPLRTALIFLGFVMVVDFFVVALAINRSLEMFASPLGTWIPFALLFTSTYVTGRFVLRGGAAGTTVGLRREHIGL
jgi:hypothetical protein